MEYERPQGYIPGTIFTKFAKFIRCLNLDGFGRGVTGSFKLRGWVSPEFSAPVVAKLHQSPKVLEVQERAQGPRTPCQVWLGSDFTHRQGRQKSLFITSSIAKCRYFSSQRATFEFLPCRANTLHRWGEIWHFKLRGW